VDLGLKDFAVLSARVAVPRFFRKSEQKLRRARTHSRHTNGMMDNVRLESVQESAMPRPVKENGRVALRLRTEDKAKILRAVALERTDLTSFILENALRAANSVIEKAERLVLSERDSLRVLDLLENVPAPNDRLLRAARSLSKAR
jgi:uncharacterized protein (DUF1778 family)